MGIEFQFVDCVILLHSCTGVGKCKCGVGVQRVLIHDARGCQAEHRTHRPMHEERCKHAHAMCTCVGIAYLCGEHQGAWTNTNK